MITDKIAPAHAFFLFLSSYTESIISWKMFSSLVLVDVATGVVREVNNYDDNNAQTLSFAIHYDCHML